jgi:hypothetical protein
LHKFLVFIQVEEDNSTAKLFQADVLDPQMQKNAWLTRQQDPWLTGSYDVGPSQHEQDGTFDRYLCRTIYLICNVPVVHFISFITGLDHEILKARSKILNSQVKFYSVIGLWIIRIYRT